MASILSALFIVSCFAQAFSQNPNYVVVVPEVFQVGVEQTVVVSVFTANVVPIQIKLETFDGAIVDETEVVNVNKIQNFNIEVACDGVPPPSEDGGRYLYVRALSADPNFQFDERRRVNLTFKSVSVFVQTDKPVYRRDDDVHIRFVAVRPDLLPLDDSLEVTFDVKNPQNVIVDRITLRSSESDAPIIKSHSLKLGHSPVFGDWTIVAKYGCQNLLASNFSFEVKDYVLPRFEVIIAPPTHIELNNNPINLEVIAKYTYGKSVVGKLNVTLGVTEKDSIAVKRFRTELFNLEKSDGGVKKVSFPNNGYGVFPEGKILYIFAEVTEKASGIRQSNTDRSAYFTNNPIKIECISSPFFKPSLPYSLKIQTKFSNGAVAKEVDVIITADAELRTATDENGLAKLDLAINKDAKTMAIKAQVDGQLVSSECNLYVYESTCDQYIIVRVKDRVPLRKTKPAEFEIVKGNNINGNFDFYVTVTSCGKLQQSFTFQNKDGPTATFQVVMETTYCSRMGVHVQYHSNCGVVADSTCVELEEKCSNDVSISTSARDATVQPGEDTDLTVTAAPHSYLALLAVDKGLYLINNRTKLTKTEIFKELLTYDEYCGLAKENGLNGTFSAVGLASLSNGLVSPRANRTKRSISLPHHDCWCRVGKIIRDIVLQTAAEQNAEKSLIDECNKQYQHLLQNECTLPATDTCSSCTSDGLNRFLSCCAPENELLRMRQRTGNAAYEILEFEDPSFFAKRNYFPHVWLWDQTFRTDSNGHLQSTIHVPDSITEWTIQGLALARTGFCAASPIKLRAFKNVFAECHLPFSLRRQEQVTIACTVYNYAKRKTQSCLRLYNPGEDLCTTAGSGKSTSPVCFNIEAEGTETILFPVVPLKTGISKLTVRLTTELSGEDVETEIRVEPEGVLKEYSFSAEIDPQGINSANPGCKPNANLEDFRTGECYKGPNYLPNNSANCLGDVIATKITKSDCCDVKIQDFSVSWSDRTNCELCPTEKFELSCLNSGKQINTFYIRLPEDYVAESDSAWLSVTGKYFEGTLKAVENVETLLREPGGCGEQSIARFAPNVAIVKHLDANGELFVEVREKHVDLIQRGYQYQLRYRKPSGGFAKYPSYQESTWLSAFVLQTFCDANSYAIIAENVIEGLITFLVKRQQVSGAIIETYTTSSYLIGGVRPGDASLTAYVVNAMLQCCQAPNHTFFTASATTALCKAVNFLELYVINGAVVRPYSRALVYAALVKACTTCKICACNLGALQKARAILDNVAAVREDGAKFWAADGGEAISVEATAYALCGYVEEGHLKSAGPLAKWLNSKRNAAGAFRSTQDTVVALRCLAQFASALTFSRSLTVKVSAVHDTSFAKAFQITDANKDLDQRTELPRNDIIKVESTGNGLAMLQVHVEYNEPTTENSKCKFNFTVEAENVNGDDDSSIYINVCALYTGDADTDQAIIEVELPTGYSSCKEGQDHCLKELNETRGEAIRLDEIETNNRGIVFYFDQIGNTAETKTCFKFRAQRDFEVRSLTSVSAKVYYYYRRDESCTTFYTVDGASPDLGVLCNKADAGKEPICVCGAGQCPKLENISERLCNACKHHDYVYRVRPEKIRKLNGWRRISVTVADILKPGRHDIKIRQTVQLWMPESCSQSVPLKVGKDYHLQGVDGLKFLLDQSAHIELWPGDLSDCKQKAKKTCQKTICAKKKRNKNKCVKECTEEQEKECKKETRKFLKYVSKLKDEKGADCERRDVCD